MLTINLVTYNNADCLANCLDSLLKQSDSRFAVLIWDNASSDETVKIVGRYRSLAIELIESEENVGFGRAHNKLLQKTTTPYALTLNPDTALDSNAVGEIIEYMETHSSVSAAQPVLLRADKKTVDSLGLKKLTSNRFVEIDQGETLSNDLADQEIFGPTGAASVWRMADLHKIELSPGEYYDQQFFLYKEDCDLAWRLQLAGLESRLIPKTKIYHDRTAAGDKSLSDAAATKNRSAISPLIRRYSYRHHLLMILACDPHPWRWPVIWYELKKLIYIIFREPQLLRYLPWSKSDRKYIHDKRRKLHT